MSGISLGLLGTTYTPPSLFLFTTATLRPATIGRIGPTLTEAKTGVTGDADVAVWRDNTSYFNVTASGIITWVIPASGSYSFEVWGAQGGNATGGNYWGGYGARMKGVFDLVGGDTLKILVGQSGGTAYGGGGGMTAVATNANVPLIVAGGGNSTSPWSATASHATTATSGVTVTAAGGTGGSGGASTAGSWGGAGFTGNPTGSDGPCSGSAAPISFINGGTGGVSCNSIGGFGGGSASDGCCYGASGAGGGYSGGGGTTGGSQYGGGGGSYNAGTSQSNDSGNVGTANLAGNGKCIITKL